jgi:hypothetical protein
MNIAELWFEEKRLKESMDRMQDVLHNPPSGDIPYEWYREVVMIVNVYWPEISRRHTDIMNNIELDRLVRAMHQMKTIVDNPPDSSNPQLLLAWQMSVLDIKHVLWPSTVRRYSEIISTTPLTTEPLARRQRIQ